MTEARAPRPSRTWLPFVIVAAVPVIAGVVIAVLIVGLSGPHDLVAAPDAKTVTVEVHTGTGDTLDSASLDTAISVAIERLERAGITYDQAGRSAGEVLVVFPDDTSDAVIANATSALTAPYELSMRPVLASDTCDPDTTSTGQADEIHLCNQEADTGYLLGPILVEGRNLTSASAIMLKNSQGAQTGQWAVNLVFDSHGTRAFEAMTEQAMNQVGSLQQFAMVLDGVVLSAPTVNAVVSDGKPQISGSFDEKSAKLLASRLLLAARGTTFEAAD